MLDSIAETHHHIRKIIMNIVNLTRCSILIIPLLITTTSALAGTFVSNNGHNKVIETLVADSELIFRGTSTEITEGLSVEGIPYTFVTYDIEEVISGQYFESTITLKFVGGTFANGNTLSASNSPQIKLGEQSILLVQQSTDTGCDFVQCELGRFLLEQGSVIAANGQAVIVDEHGSVDYMSANGLKNRDNRQANTTSNIGNFITKLRNIDKQVLSQRGDSFKRNTVKNVDKNSTFKAYIGLTQASKAPVELVAPSEALVKKNISHGSRHDKWEEAQVKRNKGNPVLTVSSPYTQQ